MYYKDDNHTVNLSFQSTSMHVFHATMSIKCCTVLDFVMNILLKLIIYSKPTFLMAESTLSFLLYTTIPCTWLCLESVRGTSWWSWSVSPFKEITALSSGLSTAVKWATFVGSILGNCATEQWSINLMLQSNSDNTLANQYYQRAPPPKKKSHFQIHFHRLPFKAGLCAKFLKWMLV